jgi:hypothetical protein
MNRQTNPRDSISHCSAVLAVAVALAAADVSAESAAPAAPSATPSVFIPPFPCTGLSTAAGSVKALARSALYTAHRDFSGGIEDGNAYPAGTFGANALFNTTVTVGGTANSCLLATLSVNAEPGDNAMVFQARIDGKPMGGQWNPADWIAEAANSPPNSLPSNFNVPIVWLPNVVNETALDPPHIAAYTFTAVVAPGTHTLEVRVAGCCHENIDVPASTPEGYIRSATFAIQHR